MTKKPEKVLLIYYNKRTIMQYATFSKNLNPRNIEKSVSDIRICIRLQTHYPARYPTGKADSDHLCSTLISAHHIGRLYASI